VIFLQFGSNTADFTLEEKRTINNADYVFVFVNDNTGKKVACTATNTSSYTDRYDRFTLTVASSNIPASGYINLDDYGFYHYFVYETADASTFDYNNIDTTDLSTLTGLVESGKMFYSTSSPTRNYYKENRTSVKTYGS